MADSILRHTKDSNGNPLIAINRVDDNDKNNIAIGIVRRLNNETSSPGEYKNILNRIQEEYGEDKLSELLNEEDINQINSFYVDKLAFTKWNPEKLGAKPPVGNFDASFYKTQVPEVAKKWNEAEKGFSFAGKIVPNLDITETYKDEAAYLHYHYTSQGKPKNIRANRDEDPAEEASKAKYYVEKQNPVTDSDIQKYRDELNGLISAEETQEILSGYGDVLREERFEAMRQDVLKKTISKLRAAKSQESELDFFKALPGMSEIYDLGSTISNELLGDSGLGGYLSMTGQSGLKEDIENMFSPGNSAVYNWQKWFDKELAERYNPSYSEYAEASKDIDKKQKIIEIYKKQNQNISAEDLAEIYSSEEKNLVFNTTTNRFDKNFLDEIGFKTTKELEDFLSKNNEDKTLLSLLKENPENNYLNTGETVLQLLDKENTKQEELKSGLKEVYLTGEDTKIKVNNEEYEIAKEEAQAFIEDYLKPRFDYSRSMDEFISYMKVSNDQQNVLQTQTLSNKIKEISEIQSNYFLNKLKDGYQVMGMDADYYFSTPKNNQNTIVNRDWEQAKEDPDSVPLQFQDKENTKTWHELAYQYGLDLTNKEDFAKLHYEVIGSDLNYDLQKDSPDKEQLAKYISEELIPYIGTEAGKIKNVFLDFVKPEEYLNTLAGNYDFLENEDVKKLLKENGIDPELYDQEEINDMFVEVLRTVPAETIRKQIEELNKKKEKPTQKLLGVSYIEREEDVKDPEEEESENAIYNIFKEAGFEGDKDEFKDFIGEDFSMEGMDLISEFGDLDFSDPMESLSKFQSLFDFEQDDAESEYNKIFGEAEKKDIDFISFYQDNAFDMNSLLF